ncbi:MAG: hypothetical protein K2Q01_07560 [Rickettsiales bacterium]|nr:hypothetical protein [Rickettsiales bacterium]
MSQLGFHMMYLCHALPGKILRAFSAALSLPVQAVSLAGCGFTRRQYIGGDIRDAKQQYPMSAQVFQRLYAFETLPACRRKLPL